MDITKLVGYYKELCAVTTTTNVLLASLKITFQKIMSTMAWSVWKERNARMKKGIQMTKETLLKLIVRSTEITYRERRYKRPHRNAQKTRGRLM